jgi:hypothetical protein
LCTLTLVVHVVSLNVFDVAELLTLFDIVIHQIPNAAASATAVCASLSLVVYLVTFSVLDVLVPVSHFALVCIVVT